MKTIRRRRKENKTNYSDRMKMLKSGRPRLIFRKTNRYILAQYITSFEAQDKVEISASSKDLLNHGWPKEFEGSLKSITASYLVGMLVGKIIQKEKKATPIVDVGMMRTIHKNKIFAFIKGLIDSGLEIPCSEEAFPEEERIKGKSLKKDFSKEFDKIKSKIEKL